MRTAAVVFALVTATACSTQKPVVTAVPTKYELVAPKAPQLSDQDLAEMHFALLKLKRVHFALDSTVLTVESRLALREGRARLEQFPDVHLYVEGHADAYGTTEYNIGLAEDRATAVCDYLNRLGMAPDRLHVVSWGEEKPLATAGTPHEHALNRRVDFGLQHGDLELHVEDGTIIATR